MSSKLRIACFLGFFLCHVNGSFLFSQADDFTNGKIINSDTKTPVPFATIRLRANQLGVYANADGDFRISTNPEFRNDSLIITCIGFTQASYAIIDLQKNTVNKIFLSPIVYGLNEVKVVANRKKIYPLALIRRAIRYIGVNYPEKPYNFISYYRDYQKRGNDYINLNEAIVQTLDNGFNTKSVSNKYRLLDFKKNTDFPRVDISPYYSFDSTDVKNRYKKIPDATLGDQYGNELFILMVHDAIRNFNKRSFSFVETFSTDFIKNHKFSDPVKVFDNNLLLYRIDFTGRENVTGDLTKISGSIYIQPDDYSIHKLEYSCYYKNEADVPKLMFNIDVEYGYENSIGPPMCLKYISFNNYFKVTDFSDTSIFKVTETYFDKQTNLQPTAVIVFNNPIDPLSAVNKNNYEVTVGKRKRKINHIQVAGKRLLIRLDNDKTTASRDSSCELNIKVIKDVNGNILGKRQTLELYQYRELFVQEYNKPLNISDTCYMQYLPLDQNCISKYTGKEKYWMNTPENIKKSK
jgi:hypothetical protein